MKPRVYLDHAATTPMRPEARAAMEHGFDIWANPSSPHAEGRKAKAALEDARERVKAALGWEGEVIFTSGASEAARIALENTVAPRKCALPVEHDALMVDRPGMFDAIVPMPPSGLIGRSEIYDAFGPPDQLPPEQRVRALFACQHVNSETGTCLGVDGYAVLAHYRDAIVLSDCSQSAGKLPLPDGIDMAIVSAHKLGGPIGVGALLVRDYNLLKPTGGHERGYRRGTENLPDILGMAAALEHRGWCTTEAERAGFVARLGGHVLKLGERQVDYILPLAHPTLSAQSLLIRLDAMGFAVSAGSACSSGTLKKSRVLDAFGVPDDVASRTIRVSLGWSTTPEELDAFADAWKSLT